MVRTADDCEWLVDLTLRDQAAERELEDGLLAHIRKFLIARSSWSLFPRSSKIRCRVRNQSRRNWSLKTGSVRADPRLQLLGAKSGFYMRRSGPTYGAIRSQNYPVLSPDAAERR